MKRGPIWGQDLEGDWKGIWYYLGMPKNVWPLLTPLVLHSSTIYEWPPLYSNVLVSQHYKQKIWHLFYWDLTADITWDHSEAGLFACLLSRLVHQKEIWKMKAFLLLCYFIGACYPQRCIQMTGKWALKVILSNRIVMATSLDKMLLGLTIMFGDSPFNEPCLRIW